MSESHDLFEFASSNEKIDIERMTDTVNNRSLVVEFVGRISLPISNDIKSVFDLDEKEILNVLLSFPEFKAISIKGMFIENK